MALVCSPLTAGLLVPGLRHTNGAQRRSPKAFEGHMGLLSVYGWFVGNKKTNTGSLFCKQAACFFDFWSNPFMGSGGLRNKTMRFWLPDQGLGSLSCLKAIFFSAARFPILFQAPGNLTRVFWHCLQMKPGVLPDVSQFGLSWALRCPHVQWTANQLIWRIRILVKVAFGRIL